MSSSIIKKICEESIALDLLSQVYVTQIMEEQNKLTTLKSQSEKMWEQFGTEMAFELHSFIANAGTKKKKLADHFEANKETAKKTF